MNRQTRVVIALLVMAILLAIGVYALVSPDPAAESIPVDPGLLKKGSGRIALSNLPREVMEAVKKAVPGGELTDAKDRIEDGVAVFDIDGKVEERHFDMLIAPDGRVVELNEQILPEKLPAAVARAIQEAAPDATISYIEKQEMNKRTIYEVKLTSGGGKGTMEFAEDGRMVRNKWKAPATAPAAGGAM